MSEPLHVWGCGTARTLRVYWALHELNLDYTPHPIRTRTTDMDDSVFLEASPGKKIPALTHGIINLTESSAIVEYIFRLAMKTPKDTVTAMQIERWSCFALTELDATALYVLRRHEDLSEIYGEAPVACSAARKYFERQIRVIDASLKDQRYFLVGTRLSKADIILGSCCFWSQLIGLGLPLNVSQWYERIKRLASFKEAIKANDI